MKIDDLSGYYVYRSFLDEPRPVGDFNKIKFAEAELWLQVDDDAQVVGQLSFPPEPGTPEKGVMDLVGTVTSWSPLKLRFVGRGRAGTEIADYEYEYDCEPTLEWGQGARQRTALVGTVRRVKDHGKAKAGATASTVAVKAAFPEPRDTPAVALIPTAIDMLATRAHRLRHTVWHTLRSDWWSLSDDDRAAIRKLRWGLDDPPFTAAGVLDLTNGAGEDFLHMHRRMIAMLGEVYRAAGVDPPAAWKTLPGPHTPQFVYVEKDAKSIYAPSASGVYVPPATDEYLQQFPESQKARFQFLKSPRFFRSVLQNVENSVRNPRLLAGMSLGAYGNLLEMTIHNWMHMRWASVPRDPKTGEFGVRGDYDVDAKWDDPKHDYLGDFHSSHVNPIFWKLHGWVDDRIEGWFAAHEASVPGEVERTVVGDVPWFKPGKWVRKVEPFDWPDYGGHGGGHGGHGGHGGGGHGGHDPSQEIRAMEEVMAILRAASERESKKAFVSLGAARLPSGFAKTIILGEP